MSAEITKAVVAMMNEVGYVQKKGTNTFQNYKYASIEGILEKVQPALAKTGLAITQNEISHDIIADSNMMEAVYEFTLHHISGEASTPIRQTGLSAVRNSKGGYDDKALNKCHTTARKYFILGLFQIPTGLAEDPDSEEDKEPVKPEPKKPTADAKLEAAKKFTDQAILTIGELKTEADIDGWYSTNAKMSAALKAGYPELYAYVDGAMKAQRGVVANG